MIQPPEDTRPDEMELEPAEQPASQRSHWIAPAWFLMGVLVGVAGLALFMRLSPGSNVSATTVRDAARQGTLDAIATLQAGGAQQSNESSGPVAQSSFELREANRLGNKSAKVTIVEFSDFQ